MSTLETVAKEFATTFKTDRRDDGTEFVHAGDCPDWMTDVIRAAHGDMMPDDTRYSMIREVAARLADTDPDEWNDLAHEICDYLVDVYNSDLLRWLSSHLSRAGYCDEAAEEYGYPEDGGIFALIGMGQFREYEEIYTAVVEGLRERADAGTEETESEES